MNGDFSFAVLPDGSKLGWDEADRAEEQRAAFLAKLETNEIKWLAWVLVRFGGDDPDLAKIEATTVRPYED